MSFDYAVEKNIDQPHSFVVETGKFKGPLDLLWSLIIKSKLEITEISLSKITKDFLSYLSLMKILDIELSSDFSLMASNLLHYKSKALLPIESYVDENFEPPLPPELVQQLMEYKKFQQAAHNLESLEQQTNEIYIRKTEQMILEFPDDQNWKEVSILDLLTAFSKIAAGYQLEKKTIKKIVIKEYTVAESIAKIRNKLIFSESFIFLDLFAEKTEPIEIVATFLAILEMVKLKEIIIRQHTLFGDIRVFKGQISEALTGSSQFNLTN